MGCLAETRWYIVTCVRMQAEFMLLKKQHFTIDPANGWLDSVEHICSPNCDDRPGNIEPDLIVIHGISLPPGEFGGTWVAALFTNTLPPTEHEYFATIGHLRVSSHVLIDRKGGLTQFVPFHMRAWHAGDSTHCGRAACNDFSIGIELEGTDDSPYEDAQYFVLGHLIRALRRTYPSLHAADVVGHCDIAPGRKTDPGPAFDWWRLRKLLIAE